MPPRLPIRIVTLEYGVVRCFSKLGPQLIPSMPYFPCRLQRSQFLDAPRTFTNNSFLLKKGGKATKKDSASSTSEKSSEVSSTEDPHDFSTLESGITKTLSKLQDDLSKLRTGGRFNPELLENVRVQLQKDSKTTFGLGSLAQVLPKGGRSVVVLVGEGDHVKPIISAIQNSRDLNLQPQQDPHNTLQLNIPVPPPTKESRDLAQAAAAKVGEAAYVGIRNARGAMQKRLRAMELNKVARPDDLRKAHKDMEKVVEKGNADVKKAVDVAKKGMENS